MVKVFARLNPDVQPTFVPNPGDRHWEFSVFWRATDGTTMFTGGLNASTPEALTPKKLNVALREQLAAIVLANCGVVADPESEIYVAFID